MWIHGTVWWRVAVQAEHGWTMLEGARDIEEEDVTKIGTLTDDDIDDAHVILGDEGGLQGQRTHLESWLYDHSRPPHSTPT